MRERMRVAFIHGTPANIGGLGAQAANAIAGLAAGDAEVDVFGPGWVQGWPLAESPRLRWHAAPRVVSPWRARYTRLRWEHGDLQIRQDRGLGSWAASRMERVRPEFCYVFTQVGLETLKWAHRLGIPTVLESPNGHIRNFREVYQQEAAKWCGGLYRGHPNEAMVERVEEEYALADRIRASSEWTKASLIAGGVPADKITILQQPVNLKRFAPAQTEQPAGGPLRICFVGSLDLRKGFVYLLDAMRTFGANRIEAQFVGATGDRCCARLLAKRRVGLQLRVAPGDPLSGYQHAEVFVLPTLEDGSPFAAAEAMASGLPAIVTDSCGSAEWVREGQTGWIVPARQSEPLATTFEMAMHCRPKLAAMGRAARNATKNRAGSECFRALADWAYNRA